MTCNAFSKTPYFIWAILYAVVVNFVLTSNLSLSLYYCEINLGDINIYSSLSVVVLLACLPGLFMAPRIVAKLGTFKCNVFVSLFMVVLILLSLPFAFMDTVNRPLFYVTFCMRFLPFGVLCASIAPCPILLSADRKALRRTVIFQFLHRRENFQWNCGRDARMDSLWNRIYR